MNEFEVKKSPTGGPYHLIGNCVWSDECKDRGYIFECKLTVGTHIPQDQNLINAIFLCDAFEIYHETGLAPKELKEQRDQILVGIRQAIRMCCHGLEHKSTEQKDVELRAALDYLDDALEIAASPNE